MNTNSYFGNQIQQMVLFIIVSGWKLTVIKGINITVSEFSGISWDQATEECLMRKVRLPNVSFDLTPEPLPEAYNTTPVWLDVTYVNKTQSVSSFQETLQKIFKCMAVSKMDEEFLYRLDSCYSLNRFLCGNPPTAELYPSNMYSWIDAQKQCQLQHNQISNMEKSEADTYMAREAWYWMFDVRKLTFQPDHVGKKDGCGYVQDGKLKFRNCSDRVPTTLCIGDPIDKVRQEDNNYSDDSNDLKIILKAVFVSLGIVCATIVAVISFIKRKQQAKESKSKMVTAAKSKLDSNVLNSQTNTANLNGGTDSSVHRSLPPNSSAIPAKNGNKTVIVTTSSSGNHRHNIEHYPSLKTDYDYVTSNIPQGNDNSRESPVASIVNYPVVYTLPKKATRYRAIIKTMPSENSEEYEKIHTFKKAIQIERSDNQNVYDDVNIPYPEYQDYDTTYDVRRHDVDKTYDVMHHSVDPTYDVRRHRVDPTYDVRRHRVDPNYESFV